MKTEQFDFTGADGQHLSGSLDLPERSTGAFALFAHCFTCTKDSLAAARIARALAAKGIGVLRFDFTGLGQSGGDFADSTFSGSVRDLIAAAEAMGAAGLGPRLLVGHSLGGTAALAAAAALPDVAAVAVIAAPFDAQYVTQLFGDGLQTLLQKGEASLDLGGRPFKLRRSFIDDLRTHDQRERIANLRRPLLILHSPQDQIVGIDNASQIFLAARHSKSFISLDRADHLLSNTADADYAAEVIAAWGSRYLDHPASKTAESDPRGVLVRETGAGRFQVEIVAGSARFYSDEPVAAGGLASGPTPYELLSAALGACTAMTLRLYADRKAWPLSKVQVVVGHSRVRAQTPPDVFCRDVALSGDLDDEQRVRLLEIAARCPVHRTLEGGAKVEDVTAGDPMPVGRDVPMEHVRDMEYTCAEPETRHVAGGRLPIGKA